MFKISGWNLAKEDFEMYYHIVQNPGVRRSKLLNYYGGKDKEGRYKVDMKLVEWSQHNTDPILEQVENTFYPKHVTEVSTGNEEWDSTILKLTQPEHRIKPTKDFDFYEAIVINRLKTGPKTEYELDHSVSFSRSTLRNTLYRLRAKNMLDVEHVPAKTRPINKYKLVNYVDSLMD